MLYIVVIVGNLMIIVLVVTDQRLHKPMYFFLINLSFIDIVITTAVIPQMLAVFITGNGVISYMGCFSQMYFYLAFESIESFLLTVMAYDRYVAICNPLRYSAIITNKKCAVLTICAWILGLCGPIANVILASLLPFCKQYKIAYWYCDYPPVVTLACIDTTFEIDLALGIALLVILLPFWIVIWSYSKIITCLLRIASSAERIKAFSTCSSHLVVVLTFFMSHTTIYICAKIKTVPPNVVISLSVLACFITPLVNPFVYSLRNKDIKQAWRKSLKIKP
ncbi:OR6N1 protein, partial [Amia calva]|nr:OR6N1 protein [Amia calva]